MARVTKICGMQTPGDVEAAADADFLGFVVESPESHRNLSLGDAAELMSVSDSYQGLVAVTATEDQAAVRHIVDVLDPDGVQITHPFEPDFLRRIHEVTGVYLSVTPKDARDRFDSHEFVVDAFLGDSLVEGYGGTGERLDLNQARSMRRVAPKPFWLAGGLTPDNVGEAVRFVDPDGVDVSTGVERPDGKAKDPEKVQAFIEEVWFAEDDEEVPIDG